LAFGSNVFAYRSIPESFITLVQMVFGQFDYPSLANANRILGPFLFVIFHGFTGFLLMNMLIAILSDIYINLQSKTELLGKLGLTNIEFDEWMAYFQKKGKAESVLQRLKNRLSFFRFHRVPPIELDDFESVNLQMSETGTEEMLEDEDNNNEDFRGSLPGEIITKEEKVTYLERDLEALADHLREQRADKSGKAKIAENLQDLENKMGGLTTEMNEGFTKIKLDMENINGRLNQLMTLMKTLQQSGVSSDLDKPESYVLTRQQTTPTYIV